MSEKELENFNIELKALLIKYDVSMTVNHGIQILKNKKAEIINPEVVNEEIKIHQNDTLETA